MVKLENNCHKNLFFHKLKFQNNKKYTINNRKIMQIKIVRINLKDKDKNKNKNILNMQEFQKINQFITLNKIKIEIKRKNKLKKMNIKNNRNITKIKSKK